MSDQIGSGLQYSIGTLVTDRKQYAEMKTSFEKKGFGNGCEFISIDNSQGNKYDAFQGLNKLLVMARGEFVILCHQDIRLDFDNRSVLDARLRELDAVDGNWAVAGNAGGIEQSGQLAIRISDPHGENQKRGQLPCRVCSLDENFIVVKNNSRVALSNDLSGFHFYGADICLQAEIRGYNAYVIDFHLRHLSGGKLDKPFFEAKSRFESKWKKALRMRLITTTCARVTINGST